ncbi:response regulator [Candidatus Entotheonella palauensis]|uniref:response regulator n=1 Tax=Candidatus Entotheonella palauensis TaxID=93172 RepID=UPI0015C42053|nr:response regulator [Candidatus Entotheonella palauensis]
MPGERILLIEDEDRLRNNLCRLLGRDGYDITIAASGEEGLAYAQGRPFHVVVTDLVMEAYERFDLLDRLVEHIPETPIIVITGHASILTKAEALSRGACDFLAKPFAISLLRGAIAQALQPLRNGYPAKAKCG